MCPPSLMLSVSTDYVLIGQSKFISYKMMIQYIEFAACVKSFKTPFKTLALSLYLNLSLSFHRKTNLSTCYSRSYQPYTRGGWNRPRGYRGQLRRNQRVSLFSTLFPPLSFILYLSVFFYLLSFSYLSDIKETASMTYCMRLFQK